ncbi:hypothetical protein [Nocardia sp. NPDC046763]
MNLPRPHIDSDTAAVIGWDIVALLIVVGCWLTGVWLTTCGAPL